MVNPQPWQMGLAQTPPPSLPRQLTTPKVTTPKKKKDKVSQTGALGGAATGAAAGATMGALGGPFAPISMPVGAGLGGLIGGGLGALAGPKGRKDKVTNPFGGGGGGNFTPKQLSPLAALINARPEDILLGDIDVSTIDTSDRNKEWKKFLETNPDAARAIQEKKNIQWENLLQKARGGQNGGVGAGIIDPLAVQMIWQNSITPFLNNVMQGSQQQTQNYSNLMGQLLNDKNLPQGYQSFMSAQVPAQVADMNMLNNSLAQQVATAPMANNLLDWLRRNTESQWANYNQQKLGQLASTGQLFGLNG